MLSKRIIKSLRFCSFQFEWFATLLIGKKDLCCLETKLVIFYEKVIQISMVYSNWKCMQWKVLVTMFNSNKCIPRRTPCTVHLATMGFVTIWRYYNCSEISQNIACKPNPNTYIASTLHCMQNIAFEADRKILNNTQTIVIYCMQISYGFFFFLLWSQSADKLTINSVPSSWIL